MALFNRQDGSPLDRAFGQFQGAQRTMGGMTKENQTSTRKVTMPEPSPYQKAMSGIGLLGGVKQTWDMGKGAINTISGWMGPDPATQAAAAGNGAASVGSGVQATQAGATNLGNVQMLSGPQPSQIASSTAQFATPATQTGGQAANAAGAANVTGAGGVSWAPMIGSGLGGLAGSLGGGALGQAIGGDTGQVIGNIGGGALGGYLGGLAGTSLASTVAGTGAGVASGAAAGAAAGTASGTAAGAATGSTLGPIGALIGAGVGLISSFFF